MQHCATHRGHPFKQPELPCQQHSSICTKPPVVLALPLLSCLVLSVPNNHLITPQLIKDTTSQQKVVVVSAMGSAAESPIKVTDLILNMIAKAARQDAAFLVDLAALQVGGPLGGCLWVCVGFFGVVGGSTLGSRVLQLWVGGEGRGGCSIVGGLVQPLVWGAGRVGLGGVRAGTKGWVVQRVCRWGGGAVGDLSRCCCVQGGKHAREQPTVALTVAVYPPPPSSSLPHRRSMLRLPNSCWVRAPT